MSSSFFSLFSGKSRTFLPFFLKVRSLAFRRFAFLLHIIKIIKLFPLLFYRFFAIILWILRVKKRTVNSFFFSVGISYFPTH